MKNTSIIAITLIAMKISSCKKDNVNNGTTKENFLFVQLNDTITTSNSGIKKGVDVNGDSSNDFSIRYLQQSITIISTSFFYSHLMSPKYGVQIMTTNQYEYYRSVLSSLGNFYMPFATAFSENDSLNFTLPSVSDEVYIAQRYDFSSSASPQYVNADFMNTNKYIGFVIDNNQMGWIKIKYY